MDFRSKKIKLDQLTNYRIDLTDYYEGLKTFKVKFQNEEQVNMKGEFVLYLDDQSYQRSIETPKEVDLGKIAQRTLANIRQFCQEVHTIPANLDGHRFRILV